MQPISTFTFKRYSGSLAVLILLTLLLTSCGPMAFGISAEDSAIKAVLNTDARSTQVDPSSVKLLQSLQLDENTYVLIAFEGNNPSLGNARSKCLGLYQVQKNRLGMWQPSSSGSGCDTQVHVDSTIVEPVEGEQLVAGPTPMPISIQGGRSSGGPNDIGTCTQWGQVFDPAIKTVKVIWSDNTTQQVDVINNAYLIARNGQAEMIQVEAIDAQGTTIFLNRPETAPGKQ